MNIVNRIIVVLLVIVSVVACWAVSLFPVPVLSKVGGELNGLGTSLQTLNEDQPALRVVAGIALALVWSFIALLFLILEFYRPRRKTVRVEKVGGGEVEVSLKTITDRIAFDVDQMTGVLKVRPKVSIQRGGVFVEVEADTAGEAEVPVQAKKIVEMIQQSVEQRIGVKLASPPKVKLNAAPVPTVTSVPVADKQLPDRPRRSFHFEPEPPEQEQEPEPEPDQEPEVDEGSEA